MNSNNNLYPFLYQIMKNETKPIPKGILMEKIKKVSGIVNKQSIYDFIDSLIVSKNLSKLENGYIVENYLNGPLLKEKLVGTISINSKLDGYVNVISGDQTMDYYINNLNLNGCLNGDEVEIQLMDKYLKNGTQHAIVTKTQVHNNKFGVGTFKLIGNTYKVVMDDMKNYLEIKLDNTDNLVNGHKILIEFLHFDKTKILGSVKKIIGHMNDVGSDILSIIYENNIEPQFDDDVLEFVNKYIIDERIDKKRRDISYLNIVSIDPPTSKDLDDAIYVEKKSDGKYFLSVSIADVSTYVPYNSILDQKTIDRATSIYLVDRVIPMLPHKLSNDECSLNEKIKRRALTCNMIINEDGIIEEIDVFPSWILSKAKLSYDEVNDLFDNKKNHINPDIRHMLFVAKQLHHILREKKNREGYIDFDLKEPKIIVDEKCFPIEITIKTRGVAQMMIEDFMVAANNAVTLKAKSIDDMPFVYRIHEKPTIDKLDKFMVEVRKTDFIIDKKDFENPTPLTFKKCLEINKNNPNLHILSKLLLRCMNKAKYSIDNYHHFGLAMKDYTHFTSPIRRYPDLIIHRLYWMYVFARELFTDQQRNEFKNSLEKLCEICTNKEIEAINVERTVNALKFCQYMSKRINQEFDGIISAITSFGFFVELDNTIEGLVKIRNIGNDFWIYNEKTNTIIGTKTNSSFNFGQKIKVRVINVDIGNRQIEFEVVGLERNNDVKSKRNNHRKLNVNKF